MPDRRPRRCPRALQSRSCALSSSLPSTPCFCSGRSLPRAARSNRPQSNVSSASWHRSNIWREDDSRICGAGVGVMEGTCLRLAVALALFFHDLVALLGLLVHRVVITIPAITLRVVVKQKVLHCFILLETLAGPVAPGVSRAHRRYAPRVSALPIFSSRRLVCGRDDAPLGALLARALAAVLGLVCHCATVGARALAELGHSLG